MHLQVSFWLSLYFAVDVKLCSGIRDVRYLYVTFDRRLKIFEILVPNCIYFKNIQQKHDIELFNKLKAHHTSTAYASDICLEPVHLYEWFQIINPQLIRYFCHLLLFKLTPQSSAAQG